MSASLRFRVVADVQGRAHEESTKGNSRSPLEGELARIGRIRRFRADEIILAEGEDIPFVGKVVSGVLRIQKTLYDGRQQILGLLQPSDMFGNILTRISHVSIEAASDVSLCCYGRSGFEALLGRFPELEHRMLLSIMAELDMARDSMLMLGSQSVTERVATYLLIVGRRVAADPRAINKGGRRSIHVPICRRDMAAYLGTTVESISRSIQEMARQQVLLIINPQHFEILSERRLRQLSGRDETDIPTHERLAQIA